MNTKNEDISIEERIAMDDHIANYTTTTKENEDFLNRYKSSLNNLMAYSGEIDTDTLDLSKARSALKAIPGHGPLEEYVLSGEEIRVEDPLPLEELEARFYDVSDAMGLNRDFMYDRIRDNGVLKENIVHLTLLGLRSTIDFCDKLDYAA